MHFRCVTYVLEVIKMDSPKIKTKRIGINIPVKVLDELDKYRELNGIPTRTTAILELIRQGLK